jgi:L-ascorbate metabolism protein UlaG (beta-lactamase superfamily)
VTIEPAGEAYPEVKRHFDGERFFNPDAPQTRGFLQFIRWKVSSRPERSPAFVTDVAPSTPPRAVEGSTVRVTLVNHSTVLLQQQGTNLLTDPVWSERVSPLSWIGPHRRRSPGIRWEDLPAIHLVLLSHNHYDHLDLPSLRKLAARREAEFVVPFRVARLLESQGIGPVHELDWGESIALRGLTIHCVPAVHFSSRGLFDRNRTLWCGYAIEAGARVLYFAGDTAYGDHFAAIRKRFGPPRLALLPIGAYEPRWMMSPVHMGPDEAVRAHQVLAAETSVAIHHGTFQLADDAIDTPAKALQESLCQRHVDGQRFRALSNGEFLQIE